MYIHKPTRYLVEWESGAKHAKLEAAAKADGTHTEDCDDWFDPGDIAESADAGETIEEARRIAKMHLHDAHYGEVQIRERLGIEECGIWWDYRDTREVEAVS